MPTANGKHNGQLSSPGGNKVEAQPRFTPEQLEQNDAAWDAAVAQAESKQSAKPAKTIIKIIPVVPPTLGEDAYLGFTGRFLRAVADHTEATDAGVLAHFLPVVGTVSGPYRHIWAGNKQPPRINTILVGGTNRGRKGTSGAPVDLFMERVDAAFWNEQRGGGLSSGEGLINAVSDKRDAEGNIVEVEKRMYVPEEEFSRVLAQFHRDGNTLSQVIRQAYDNGNLATMTVNPRRAYGAHISIVGHITPEELKEKLGGVEMANGLGNRFLWFLVDSEKIIARPKPIPDSVFLDFEPKLRTLLMIGAEKNECQVGLDKAAQDHWETLYSELREDRAGLAGAMISRGASMVLRLALIYALLEEPIAKGRFRKDFAIRLPYLKAAEAVWDYCQASTISLFDSETGDQLCDKLLRLLGENGGPMSKNDFNRHLSKRQKDHADAALKKLQDELKRVRSYEVKSGAPGRPATVWELRPQ
jgi:hypothetical protein